MHKQQNLGGEPPPNTAVEGPAECVGMAITVLPPKYSRQPDSTAGSTHASGAKQSVAPVAQPKTQLQILALSCTSCVTLGQLLNISGSGPPHLYTRVADTAGVKFLMGPRGATTGDALGTLPGAVFLALTHFLPTNQQPGR